MPWRVRPVTEVLRIARHANCWSERARVSPGGLRDGVPPGREGGVRHYLDTFSLIELSLLHRAGDKVEGRMQQDKFWSQLAARGADRG